MSVKAAMRKRLAIISLILVPVISHVIIVKTKNVRLGLFPHLSSLFKLGFVMSSAITHWAIYTTLLLTFALTLRPGHDPLITAMARRLQGPLSDELARYTRRVTICWSCFFASQLMISITLFWFAPLVVWSFFVNILDIPLVATMFAVEYLVRLNCLSDPPRHSLSAIIRMVADIRKPPEETAGSL